MQNLNTNFTTAATTSSSGGFLPTTAAQAIGFAGFVMSATTFTFVSTVYCTKGISRLASKALKNYRGTKPVGTQTDDLSDIERGEAQDSETRLSSDYTRENNSRTSSALSINNKIAPITSNQSK